MGYSSLRIVIPSTFVKFDGRHFQIEDHSESPSQSTKTHINPCWEGTFGCLIYFTSLAMYTLFRLHAEIKENIKETLIQIIDYITHLKLSILNYIL